MRGHLRAEMGGCGVGDRVGPEGKWWEQMYGGGKASRMGGSGRKGYYEKMALSSWDWILGRERSLYNSAGQVLWLSLRPEAESPGRLSTGPGMSPSGLD